MPPLSVSVRPKPKQTWTWHNHSFSVVCPQSFSSREPELPCPPCPPLPSPPVIDLPSQVGLGRWQTCCSCLLFCSGKPPWGLPLAWEAPASASWSSHPLLELGVVPPGPRHCPQHPQSAKSSCFQARSVQYHPPCTFPRENITQLEISSLTSDLYQHVTRSVLADVTERLWGPADQSSNLGRLCDLSLPVLRTGMVQPPSKGPGGAVGASGLKLSLPRHQGDPGARGSSPGSRSQQGCR